MIEQCIDGNTDKVHQHNLYDRPQPCHGSSHGSTQERGFAYGSRTHPLFPEAHKEVQAECVNVFPEYNDPGIFGHSLSQCILNRIGKAQGSHALSLLIERPFLWGHFSLLKSLSISLY
jgi:hypothetical protein